jgi:hypothetical protein
MAKIDYVALFGGDDYDPCAALRALRPAYMEAVASGSVRRARFRDRDVEFNSNNHDELGRLMRQLETECAQNSGRNTARAISAGYRRQI